MLIVTLFFVIVLLVILVSLLFCYKSRKQNKNDITNKQMIHFKLSIFKNTYAEFDYKTTNDKKKNSPP